MEEEKVQEPEVKAEEPKEDKLQELVTKLNELGITSTEQLENKAKAASEAGRLANMVGSLREEIAELKSSRQKAPEAPVYDDAGINIDEAISGAVRKSLREEREAERNLAMKAEMARIREIQSLKTDNDYPIIGDKFERFMNTPEARIAMYNGETMTSIYNKMVRMEYRNMLVQMKDSVENRKGNPSKTIVPHMESNQTAPPRIEATEERKNKLNKIKESWSGTDSDLEKALNTLLPSGTLPIR